MMRLLRFELAKIWCKKPFLAILMVLLLTNLLLQWYGNRESERQPGLQSYRKAAETMADMTEQEKFTYLQKLSEDLENLRVTDQIAMWMGRDQNSLEDLSAEHQEIFRQWYPVYQEGDFLTYTDSLDKEILLINELFEEAKQVTGYETYLQEMQSNQQELSGISIFAKQNKDSFSKRNIEKSREDYSSRTTAGVRWIPSKGPVSMMDNLVTGILLLVGVLLFAVWGIMEEKEKKLFYITRATNYGVFHDMWARMTILGINCMIFSILLYGCNYIFYGITTGFWNLSIAMQSIDAYMQSCYSMSMGEFMLLSVLTKAVTVYCFGLLLQWITILSRNKIIPFVLGILILAGNILLYELLPAVGAWSPLKYINLIGVFHTENVWGDYLNFNICGYPLSRTVLSVILLGVLFVGFCIMVTIAFWRGDHFSFPAGRKRKRIACRPYAHLFSYECYKILISNRALFVLLACLALSGAYYATRNYSLSAKEEYYQDLMMKLEGELTEDKEAILLAENQRYESALSKLEQIAALEEEGKLGEIQAEEQRDPWYAVLQFYPAFQRAWKQYERIQKDGGQFLYDTGYLYLLGIWGEGFLMELLIFAIGLLLIFSNSVSMEYQNHTDLLIYSSTAGMKKVLLRKAWLCILVGLCFPVCMWIFHRIHLQKTFPMHHWTSSIQTISCFRNLPVGVPIWLFVAAVIGIQILVCCFVALCVTLLSSWRKNFMQTILIGMVLFVVPLVLYAQGIDFMKWLTVYPWYVCLVG